MNILSTIHEWLSLLGQNNSTGRTPAFLPLTAEEISEAQRFGVFFSTPTPVVGELYGMLIHETAYAVQARARQLTVPYIHLEETKGISYETSHWYDCEKMRSHLIQRVCAETTTLQVKFEWDCWAALKRALRITRFFPVKTKTVLIDGRVLYPFLKVGLPHNRHSVQFKVL